MDANIIAIGGANYHRIEYLEKRLNGTEDGLGLGFYIPERFTTLETKKGTAGFRYIPRDDLREASWDIAMIEEKNGNFEGYFYSDLEKKGKTPVIRASADSISMLADFLKKKGDTLFAVLLKSSEREFDQSVIEEMRSHEELFLERAKNTGGKIMAIADVYDKPEAYIIPEFQYFVRAMHATPRSVKERAALQEHQKALKAVEDWRGAQDRAEKLRETHAYLLGASTIVAAATGGIGAALAIGLTGTILSKIRREHIKENWFLKDGFSTKDALLYSMFSGMMPEETLKGVKSKEDIEDAVKKFEMIKHENTEQAGIVKKALLYLGDKIMETSIEIDMMNAIKSEKDKFIQNVRKEKTGEDPDLLKAPVETAEIYQSHIDIKI